MVRAPTVVAPVIWKLITLYHGKMQVDCHLVRFGPGD
jgi:hypothetical protein